MPSILGRLIKNYETLITDPVLQKIEWLLLGGHIIHKEGYPDRAQEIFKRVTAHRLALQKSLGYDALRTRVLSGRWVENIGHFLFLDAYIKLFKLGLIKDIDKICLFTDLYYKDPRISNACLLNLYKNHIAIRAGESGDIDDSQRTVLHWLREELEHIWLDHAQSKSMAIYDAVMLADELWTQAKRPPLIQTTDEIDSIGMAFLSAQGISETDWFVCLHARSPGYNGLNPRVRDCSIETYIPLIKQIIAWGGRVVRLGNDQMPAMPAIDGLIDYAQVANKDPRIDIFLASHCRFFIGCSSGLESVPMLFNIPLIQINWAPIGHRPLLETYYVPKTYIETETRQAVSLQRIKEINAHEYEGIDGLAEKGIAVIDLTSDEILESVCFFYKHVINGAPVSTKDAEIQIKTGRYLDAMEVKGKGKIIPGFSRNFPEFEG